LGKKYPDVHDFLDAPYFWKDSRGRMLKGRHRVLRHNALTPSVVFVRELAKSGDAGKALKKAVAASIHITADMLL